MDDMDEIENELKNNLKPRKYRMRPSEFQPLRSPRQENTWDSQGTQLEQSGQGHTCSKASFGPSLVHAPTHNIKKRPRGSRGRGRARKKGGGYRGMTGEGEARHAAEEQFAKVVR